MEKDRGGGGPAAVSDGKVRRDRAPIIMACASAYTAEVEAAARGLRSLGYATTVLPGADTRPIELTQAVESHRGQGLYVLCVGDSLDAAAVERLRQLLHVCEVPPERRGTVPAGTGGHRALQQRILSMAERSAHGPAPVEPPEAVEEDGGASLEATIPFVPPARPVPEHAPSSSGSHPGVPTYTRRDRTQLAAAPVLARGGGPGVQASSTGCRTPGAAPVRAPNPSSLAWVWMGCALIALVLLGVVVTWASPAEPDAPGSGSVAREEAKTQPESSTPASAQPVSAETAGPTAHADPVVVADPDSAGDPVAQDGDPAESPGASANPVPAHRSQVDPALLDPDPLPADAPLDDEAVRRALDERKIRSWNAFLLAGDRASAMALKDAEALCSTLEVGGIAGWRLPSVGELVSLADAGLLANRVYWSETPGDAFGETRMVLNVRKNRVVSIRSSWDGARSLCVRVRD